MRKTAAIALFILAVALLDVAAAVQGNGAGDAGNPPRLAANVNAAAHDYDRDDNGLIEVDRLARLYAIRWDLDGNGAADDGVAADDAASYAAAFPDPAAGMGCPAAGCTGYELTQNLDFDTDGDGATYTISAAGAITGDADDAYYNGGQGWRPIGSRGKGYNAAFDGGGYVIANLYIYNINIPAVFHSGLFGGIGRAGAVKNLGMLNVNVTHLSDRGGSIGSLVGTNQGAVANCYATGSVVSGGNATHSTGGLVGHVRFGTIRDSYAAAAVSGKGGAPKHRNRIGGLTGMVTRDGAAVVASYATGPVTAGDHSRAGGLVGNMWNGDVSITASYATGAVSGGDYSEVGGLLGLFGGNHKVASIIASYAAGAVTVGDHGAIGSLAGGARDTSVITDSYAIGAVSGGADARIGGLAGSTDLVVTNSYWNAGSTGQSGRDHETGDWQTTRDLQSPTNNEGIYENWHSRHWDFGTARQYPAVQHNGDLVPGQRQTSLQVDWDQPIVGEPVAAGLHLTDNSNAAPDDIAWQWQRSATGAKWTDIADAAAAVYVPVAADAADGGHFLRAQVTFTAAGQSQTLTTYNTAKVAAESAVTEVDGTAALAPDVAVGRRLEYAVPSAGNGAGGGDSAGDSNSAGVSGATWRWQRCADRAMQSECRYLPAGASSYTITVADVGQYLRAYVYYADADGGEWRRAATPVLGPVLDPATAESP